jgi:hypothetical protein
MKPIKIFSIFLAVLLLFSACENDAEIDTPSYGDTQWIQFQSEALSTNEANTINIPVLLASSENSSGFTVDFTVTSDNPNRFNITQTGSVTIPAGEFSANIELIPVDDNEVNGDALVTLTIANSDIGAGLGGQGVRFNSVTVTVVDDDCIPMPAATYTASVRAFNDDAPSYTAMLTPIAGTTNQFFIDSAWGPNFVGWATGDPSFNGSFIYPATIVINADLTIDVIGGAGYATGGSGTYDSCGDVFTFTLTQGLFTTDFTVDVTLVGN